MDQNLIMHKVEEVKNFLHSLKDKLTGTEDERLKEAEDALDTVEHEVQDININKKVQNGSENRDISAI